MWGAVRRPRHHRRGRGCHDAELRHLPLRV